MIRDQIQERVQELARELGTTEFYNTVNNELGLVQSQAGEYLVGTNEYSVAFGVVVSNPLFSLEAESRKVRRKRP
jgi:hypothetical protein